MNRFFLSWLAEKGFCLSDINKQNGFGIGGENFIREKVLIRPDPDPKHCLYASFIISSLLLF